MPDEQTGPEPKAAQRGFWVLALITIVLWASAFVLIRVAIKEYSPGHLALLRFAVASLTLTICAARFGVRVPDKGDWPGLVFMGFCGFTAYNLLLNRGEKTVTAGSAAFLVNTSPIWTALLAPLLLNERLSLRQWIGISVAFCGVSLIAFGEHASSLAELRAQLGATLSPDALLILLAAICTSFYIIVQKRFLGKYRPFELTCYGVWSGAALLLFFSRGLIEEIQRAPLSATLAVVFMGVFPGALAYAIWAFVLQRTAATVASSLLYSIAPVSLLLAWLWLDEVPSTPALLGGFVVLSGVVAVNWRRREVKAVIASPTQL
jgi:drug/metabolite transporter (DMT)-like permease